MTVVLTTHAMDEAEHLCDRVGIIDHGRLVACDSPDELTTRAAADETTFATVPGLAVDDLARRLGVAPGSVRELRPGDYLVDTAATPALVAALTAWLREQGALVSELRAGRRQPRGRLPPPHRRRTLVKASSASPRRRRVEMLLTVRRGESLLVTLVIPLGILVFFSKVDAVNTTYKEPVDFLVPGVLALAVMSSAMVSLGIATGYERRYGVLKRLGFDAARRGRAAQRQDPERARARGDPGVGDRAHRHRVRAGARPAVWRSRSCSSSSARWRSRASGCCSRARCGPRRTWRWPTASSWCCSSSAGMAYPLAKLPDALEIVRQGAPAAALSETVRAALTPGVGVPDR